MLLLGSWLVDRNVDLCAQKVAAHTPLSVLVRGQVDIRDFLGNHLADAVCGGAADAARLAEPASAEVEQWEARAEAIAMRIGILEAAAWSEEAPSFEPPIPLPPFETLILVG